MMSCCPSSMPMATLDQLSIDNLKMHISEEEYLTAIEEVLKWVKASRDRTFKGILEIMQREGLDEEGAMAMVLDLGLKDYVVELYRRGDVTIREAAAILGLNLRQTLEIVEKKMGGNVRREEAIRALELAKKLADSK